MSKIDIFVLAFACGFTAFLIVFAMYWPEAGKLFSSLAGGMAVATYLLALQVLGGQP